MTGTGTAANRALAELRGLRGVRAAMLVRDGTVVLEAEGAGLGPEASKDIAKTVRRMQLASSTVGAGFDEVCISLAGIRLLVRAVGSAGAVVLLLRRGADLQAVRSHLGRVLPALARAEVEAVAQAGGAGPAATAPVESAEDEAERLWRGPLRPILERVRECYVTYVPEAMERDEAHRVFQQQLREWLLCCNPSSYTFPLLLDGLAQTLDERPGVRRKFKEDVQQVVTDAGPWREFEEGGKRVGS